MSSRLNPPGFSQKAGGTPTRAGFSVRRALAPILRLGLRVHQWLYRPRIDLGEELFEVFGMTNYVMTFALVAHIFFIPLFLVVGAPFLALFNILSVAVFLYGAYLARRTYFVPALLIGTAETVVHAWLVTIWLGLFTFAHLFMSLALELNLLLTPVALRTRLLLALAISFAYVSLVIFGIHVPPIIDLPTSTTTALAALNVTIFLAVSTGMAVYYSWTVRTTRHAWHKAEADLQVAHDRAVDALADAREANKAKSTFLANMSHELRTPLNAIIGYSEMIGEDAESEETRDDAGKIETAGRHLLSLIDEILDLSKIEAGRMELSLSHFTIDECLAPVVDAARPLADKGGNAFEVSVDNGAVTMHSDIKKIRQILLNLLSNACKFTKSGTVSLRVSSETIANVPCVRIIVADTGIGIKQTALEKIFLDFVQAETSTSEKYGGTGLGLALSKKFCELLGGSITAESELGKGSRFIAVVATDASAPRTVSLGEDEIGQHLVATMETEEK